MTLADIDKLIARCDALNAGEETIAVSVLRDAHVLARTLFGPESPHVQELEQTHFSPVGVIYNKGHYMNDAAWKDGCATLARTLKSMRYEFELKLSETPELLPPDKVTIPWLLRHFSWQVWLTFLGIVAASFATGFAAGRNDFFQKLMDLFNSSPTP